MRHTVRAEKLVLGQQSMGMMDGNPASSTPLARGHSGDDGNGRPPDSANMGGMGDIALVRCYKVFQCHCLRK